MADPTNTSPDHFDARLGRELRVAASAAMPHRPATVTIVDRARQQQRRQRRAGAVVVLAAAILLVAGLTQIRDRPDVVVDQVPPAGAPMTIAAAAPPPWRLVLDPAFARTDHVQQATAAADGRPPGTTPGPEGRSTHEVLAFRQPGSLAPPWLHITIRTTANPTGPWGDIYDGQQRVTVGSRQGVLQTSSTPHMVMLKYDDTREISAMGWQLDDTQVIAAVAALRQDPDGHWHLDETPRGPHEVGTDQRCRPDPGVVLLRGDLHQGG
jgi:hypothetical protein